MNKKVSNIFKVILGVVILLTINVTIISMTINDRRRSRNDHPPALIKTIADFREWRPTFTNVHRVVLAGLTNYYIDNPRAHYASGSPRTYVFDANGNYSRTTELTADIRSRRFIQSAGVFIERSTIDSIPTGNQQTNLNE